MLLQIETFPVKSYFAVLLIMVL